MRDSHVVTFREHWATIKLTPNETTKRWDQFINKTVYDRKPVQIAGVRYFDEMQISHDALNIPGSAVTTFTFLPQGDPIILTVETQSQILANGVSDFSLSMGFAFPKNIVWLTGAQISFFVRIQVDYSQPIVAKPAFVADFSSCLRTPTFVPISVSSTTRRILYCIAVAGIAKPFSDILDAVTLTFNWEWVPGAIATETELKQTISMSFWGSGYQTELTDVSNQIVPAWLFEDRYNRQPENINLEDFRIGADSPLLHTDEEWVSIL